MIRYLSLINLNVMFITLCMSGTNQAMMRFRAPSMLAAVTPIATLLTPKRGLLSNQRSDPEWIKINHEVTQCAQWICAVPPTEEKKQLIRRSIHYDVAADPFIRSVKSESIIVQEIHDLFKKHAIDLATVTCYYCSNPMVKQRGIGLIGDSHVLINPETLQTVTAAQRKALIEKTICHIICQDKVHIEAYLAVCLSNRNKSCVPYMCLCNKRADIHSALQSVENAREIHNLSDGPSDIIALRVQQWLYQYQTELGLDDSFAQLDCIASQIARVAPDVSAAYDLLQEVVLKGQCSGKLRQSFDCIVTSSSYTYEMMKYMEKKKH